MKNSNLLLILCLFFLIQLSNAQTKNIGHLIVPTFMDKSIGFVINSEDGSYNGSFKLKEPFMFTNSNKEDNIGYALTRHKVYTIDLLDAQIIDSLEVFKYQVKIKEDINNPNLYFIPFYVSEKGIAFYGQMNMKTFQYDIYRCDAKNRNRELILSNSSFNIDFAFINDEIIQFQNNSIIVRNAETLEVLNTFDNIIPEDQKENAKNLILKTQGDVLVINCYPDIENKYVFKYSRSKQRLIDKYVTPRKMIFEIEFENCTKAHYIKHLFDYPNPPVTPKFPVLKGASKNKLAKYKAKVDKIMADHILKNKAWIENASKFDNGSIIFYTNEDQKETKVKVERAKSGTLYNDRYLLINRNYEVELYDIIDKKSVWTTDLDL